MVAQEAPTSLERGTTEAVWETLSLAVPLLLLLLIVVGTVLVVRHRRMTPLAADE